MATMSFKIDGRSILPPAVGKLRAHSAKRDCARKDTPPISPRLRCPVGRHFRACICQILIYNPPPEGNHETLLFFTRACLLARRHTLGRGRSFLREMETQHGEKQ